MIYLFILILLLVSAARFDNKPQPHTFNFVLNGILLISLAGFRNYVGGDTMGYIDEYESYPTLGTLTVYDFIFTRYAPGWVLFWSFCKSLSPEFWVFQLIHAIIVNSVMLYVLNKYCPRYKFTVLVLYFVFVFFKENMEVLREALATCIFLIAYPCLLQRSVQGTSLYLSLIVVGSFFHPYAAFLLFLPFLMPLLDQEISLKRVVGLLIAMGVFFFTPLINILTIVGIIKPEALHKYLEIYTYASWSGLAYAGFLSLVYYLFLLHCERTISMPRPVLIGLRLFVYMQFMGLFFPVISTRLINYINVFFYISLAISLYEFPRKLKIFKACFLTLLCVTYVRGMTRDVSAWTYDDRGARRYYFYERYIPYYSIWEDVPEAELMHRKAIASQEAKNDEERYE